MSEFASDFPPIEDLLAHRDNMLLLSGVRSFSATEVSCFASPDTQAWYADEKSGAMPAWIGIELMAQSVAAHVALLAINEGRPPRPGALLGTRNYRCSVPAYLPGETLTIYATEMHRSPEGLGSYDCRIETTNGGRLAEASLTVYEPTDFKQFILGKQ